MAAHGSALSRLTPTRAAVYRQLLLARRPWSVRDLHAALDAAHVSPSGIRSVLYHLHAERLVDKVAGEGVFTVMLNDDGTDALRRIVRSWNNDKEQA